METEILKDMDSPVPMIADMSSDIFSRPLDVLKIWCIYGGAQRTWLLPGVTFVVIKDELLGQSFSSNPTMLDYRTPYQRKIHYSILLLYYYLFCINLTCV